MECCQNRPRSSFVEEALRLAGPSSSMWVFIGLIALCLANTPIAFADDHGHSSDRDRGNNAEAGVAAPSLRVGINADYFKLDETETYDGAGPNTLSIPSHEGQRTRADIIGTLPITHALGARFQLRGSIGHAKRSLDGLTRGNNELSKVGAGAELFLRNPAVGSIAVGGGYDRVARDGPIDADEFHGNTTAQIYFPDLGMGAVDWTFRFDFTHRQVSGVTGSADVDADDYRASAHAGWYASPNVQIVIGVEWERSEYEFSSEVDTEGIAMVRWWLPLPVPVELRFGGSIGVSEYKQPPFRADKRAIYGATAGLVFRFGSGETLIDSVRRYD